MPIVTVFEYAKMRGVTSDTICEKISQGIFSARAVKRLPGRKNYQIDSDVADLELEFSGVRLLSLHETGEADAIPDEDPEENEDISRAREQTLKYRDARTNSEELRARKLQIEIDAKEAKLLPADEVRKKISKLVTETKDSILNVPSKLAPLLVSIKNPVEMEEKLLRALNEALGSLSRLDSV